MELSELLQWVAQSGKTGTLVIDTGTIERRIFFDKGQIIATASSEPNERLGHFLIKRGLLDEETLDEALQSQATADDLLGKILVELGVVSESDLERLLVVKAEESIFEIFLWPAGEFRFVDDQPLEGNMIPMHLDVTSVVLKGAERVDEWRRITQTIPSPQCLPVALETLESDDEDIQHVYSLVNDDRTIAEIIEQSGATDFFVHNVLFKSLERGRIKVVRPRKEVVPTKVEKTTVDATTHLLIADRLIGEDDFHTALRHLNAARALDPQGSETAAALDDAEDRISSVLDQEGLVRQAVPQLNLNPETIPALRLSPEEGFVLSRIDGTYDIESILKISPMPPIEARLVFRKLMRAGHISMGESP